MKKILGLIAVMLIAASTFAQTPQVGGCYTNTISATGYTLVFTNNGAQNVSINGTYYTTGSPSGVSIAYYAANFPQATATPFIQGSAITNTTGADLGAHQGQYRYWYARLATLSAGTNPTVVLNTCIQSVPNPATVASVQNSAVYSDNGTTGTIATGKTLAVTDADALTEAGVIVPQTQTVTYRCVAAATCTTTHFFIADAAYQVTAVNAVWSTAESTAANLRIQVEKLTGTTAPGSGTAMLTNNSNNGISIKGTANTVTAGTLSGTVGNLQLASGNRVGLKYETAPTEGAGVVVTITLKRI